MDEGHGNDDKEHNSDASLNLAESVHAERHVVTQSSDEDETAACLVAMGFDPGDCSLAMAAGKVTVESIINWILLHQSARTERPRPVGCESTTSGTRANQGLVDQITSMGFELPEIQDAFQHGNKTADTAVEWILGRRAAAYDGSTHNEPRTLTIHQAMTVDEPGIEPSTRSVRDDPYIDPYVRPDGPAQEGLGDENRRRFRDNLDDKERKKARRDVLEAKADKKKCHTEILRQITDDRKRVRSLKSGSSPAPSAGGRNDERGEVEGGESVDVTGQCHIQIRLPNGKVVRTSLHSDSKLVQVLDCLTDDFSSAYYVMQPFPHKVFSDSDLNRSLRDLKLVPSASLALSPREPHVSKSAVTDMDEEQHPEESGEEANMIEEEGEVEREDVAENEVEDEVVDEGEGEEEDAFAVHLNRMRDGEYHADIDEQHHVWGEGHSLEPRWQRWFDPHGPVHAHHQHRAVSLAGEAAVQRSGIPPPPAPQGTVPQSALTHTLPSLTHMSTLVLMTRILDPRVPYVALSALPEAVNQRILHEMITHRTLTPKALNNFINCKLRSLVLDSYQYTTNELVIALRYHTHLVSLSLRNCEYILNESLTSITGLKQLTVLTLAGCTQLSDKSLPYIAELEQLKSLSVEGLQISDAGVEVYTGGCRHLKTLEHLNLSHTHVTDCVFTLLEAFTNLRSLSLEATQVVDLQGLTKLTSLSALNLASTAIHSLSLTRVPPGTLRLNLAKIADLHGDDALRLISGLALDSLVLPDRLTTTDIGVSYLSRMPLTTLDLTNYIHVGDGAMAHIANITSLKRLLLPNTKVSDAGLRHLTSLRDLEVLYLDKTQVTDDGVLHFSAFKNLMELSLSSTAVTSVSLCNGDLDTNILLDRLNLSWTSVTDSGIEALKLPYLTLLNLDGTMVKPDIIQRLSGCPRLQQVSLHNLKTPTNQSGLET